MNDIVRNVSRRLETIVSEETGEVIDQNVKTVQILANPDDFALIYSGFWNTLLDNPLNRSDMELLSYLIKNYADNNPFTINTYIKEQVSKRTGKSVTSYNNCTRHLLNSGLIYKVGKRTYKINPKYAYKGSSSTRNKLVIEMISTSV